ncbi:ead/Ea22-like family protein [Klebsiella michiganensis]|uniref:ead/Ea22-like family protein n=1 Tax=Klebsiella michiganensis TaxID=1134687 RepID=UPI0022471A12|nr:ead/Ea22-like family protein [Klebsiella michiganensis]MCW9452128.1 ead/Ea22-like family protein [Klebsiella michiganensis]
MTTDITELAPAMKAAAEKATPGPWGVARDGKTLVSNQSHPIATVSDAMHRMLADGSTGKDAEFIALANPANILALVEALEKAQQEAEELSKFKEVMTSAAEALKAGSPLNLESLFKGELASAMFAMMLAGEFIRSGATNYLELLYDAPEFGGMTVTLQKVEGKTPGQRIAELEESNAQVIQSRDHYKRMTDEGLKQLAEARTVKLPKPISVLHRREFTEAHCAIYAYPEAELNAALDDAGIKVEGE